MPNYRSFLSILLALLWLAGCLPGRPPLEATNSPTIPPTSTPPPVTPTVAPIPLEMRIQASDGLQIAGTFTPGAGPAPQPAVLLLHMIYGKRGQWKALTPLLNERGIATLAIDLRGHGETSGTADWTLAADDVLQAYRFLSSRPEVDAARTGLVGASLGANLALVGAAELPEKPCLALLSPGLDYYKVRTQDAMKAYGLHPVFIAVSQGDSYAAESSEKLAQMAPGTAELHLFEGDAHGADLLASQPALPGLLLDWLEGCLQ